MKISRIKLIKMIRETAGEMRSREAIANAQSMREDGLSFEDFTTELLDYLEDQTNQQWSEEMLSDDWNYYDEWIEGADPRSIGSEYLADAASYMMENKMKITKRQLRRIIKEAMTPDVPDVMGAIGGGKFQPREEDISSFRIAYRTMGYGGRRIISRDRAWLEFVPQGSPPETREDMFRAVTLLKDGDPEVLKALQATPPKSMGPLESYDVYSVYATTTG